MTFLSAWRLVLLVAPAALLVAYVAMQRRRHTQVLRFTSVDKLDSVAPTRSGWQRHLSAVALGLALVVLTLAFAQPAMAVRTARERATILLTLDTSGSMAGRHRRRSDAAGGNGEAGQSVREEAAQGESRSA